ncbi:MAG: hypothetical protein HY459_02880 [Parcubacteria group bacterium]|nr:hypothetical protein [Parcubacteria group bacterium]
MSLSACRRCGKPILWNERKPYDCAPNGNGGYRPTEPHWKTCAGVKLKEAKARCPICLLQKHGLSIITAIDIGEKPCLQHGSMKQIYLEGKWISIDWDSLMKLRHEAKVQQKRHQKQLEQEEKTKQKHGSGMDVFLG